MNKKHTDRVKSELLAAGMTHYGLTKLAARELPRILHEDEHIGGVIYGQVGSGSSAMLVATDHRIIFIDRRTLFMTIDELTYDVVSGIKCNTAGPFVLVSLHTRITDYTLRYVNLKCARIFTTYIERKRLEKGSYDNAKGTYTPEISEPLFKESFDKKAVDFLKSRDLGVLSTIDRTGNVHGAFVYYLVDQNSLVYILTKADTGKGRNIYAHSQVALTIHEPGTLKTLQLDGLAEVETDQSVKDMVHARQIKPRHVGGNENGPPVAKLDAGAFMVIRIQPRTMTYHDFASQN